MHIGRTSWARACLGLGLSFGLALEGGCATVDDRGDPLDDEASADEALADDEGFAEPLALALPAPVACNADEATFYNAPDLSGKADGALLKCRALSALADLPGYNRYRIMYKSSTLVRRGSNGSITETRAYAATGEVYVPTGETITPTDRPAIVSMHGLIGLLADCAPSKRNPFSDRGLIKALAQGLADAQTAQGKPVVVVPDLLGMGTPSGLVSPDSGTRLYDWLRFRYRFPFRDVTHSYVSIEGQGRAAVDALRAARSISNSGLSASPRWFAVGESQGGHGALSVGEVVKRGYGSELRLRGVIAGAPGSALNNTDHLLNPVKSLLVPSIVAGLSLEWPDVRPAQLLSNNGMLAFGATTGSQCLSSFSTVGNWMVEYFTYVGTGSVTRGPLADALASPALAPALRANSPGHAPSAAPMFVAQVDSDPFVPRERTDALAALERSTNSGLVTYCTYNTATTLSLPSDPGQWSSWFTKVSENHRALSRTFGKSPAAVLAERVANKPLIRECIGPNGSPIAASTANAASWHPVEWAKARYLAP